jgi:hypothetical protein
LTDNEEDPDGEAIKIGKLMAARLREVKTLRNFEGLASTFEKVKGEGEFNRAMSRLYDQADRERVWVD